ncbi:MAG: YebC/PmpR family DNA-binding transcriptional regulator [Acidobacteriota bacterium]
MAGHSKWANIKRRKGAQDAKRGKLFTKLLREVTVATKQGGGDPGGNPRLRAAIQECKGNNVPNDKIDKAIAKGSGDLEGANYEEIVYEGYAPSGVAVMIEAMTDNRNRTVGEIRHVFGKYGGNLGENGCVGYLFEKRGYFQVDPESMGEDDFMELALELEVDDVTIEDDSYELFTDPGQYADIRQALEDREVKVESGQLAMVPSTSVEVEGDKLPKVFRLLEALEDLDDVQNVWSNVAADEALLEAAAG